MTDQTDISSPPDLSAPYKAMLDAWGAMLAPIASAGRGVVDPKDKRFAGPEWEHPVFDLIRQGYSVMSRAMLQAVDDMPGLDNAQRSKAHFAMRTLVEAMSPANSPLTNPKALNKAIETNGQSLLTGMTNMLGDLQRGQLTHVERGAFEVGVNIATTPGKVVHETPLYQLIQYAPTTPTVGEIPLVIFPPWINRFYILDLSPEKSFIRWAVAQGLTVFMVSWKSADESMAETRWDDYVAAQIEAVDIVRSGLDVPAVHTIGYCVAGTTLAATLAVQKARGHADRILSATFFTAQVDFADGGELLNFLDDGYLGVIDAMSGSGFVDGRVITATFNLLRGKDLIWSTVASNYLLGEDYPAFDLLHWNGDTTNLPAKWHRAYLTDLYRDNKLVEAGAMTVLDVPIDLSTVDTPTYVQAGREDHIAPPVSVWKLTHHLRGPVKFVLAGSGHIAGVVNPPDANKYGYWTNDASVATLDEFVAGATETKGSWWTDWIEWIRSQDGVQVDATGARVPGEGALPAIEEAPGRYVKSR